MVSWHYVAFGHGASLTPYAQVPALYPVAAYGWLGVELFFLISGFVICMSSIGHTLGEFVTSRITRLYPAYWFAIVLTTAVLLLWPGQSRCRWSDVAVNLTMFQSGYDLPSVDAVYWTLWIELHFYVLFAIVVWRGVTYRRVATFCGAWLVASVIGRELGGKWDTMLIADYAPFFVAGVAFYPDAALRLRSRCCGSMSWRASRWVYSRCCVRSTARIPISTRRSRSGRPWWHLPSSICWSARSRSAG